MSSPYETCNNCGRTISFNRMRHGQVVPMNPDGSGKHVCIPRSGSAAPGQPGADRGIDSVTSTPARRWRLESLGRRLTSTTRCWWCDESVFFHTNGNGDCVLLEALGWPWPIHSCWLIHREESERRIALSRLETELERNGYDGTGCAKPDESQNGDTDDDFDVIDLRRRMANCLVKLELEDDPSMRFVRLAGFLSKKATVSLELASDACCEPWDQIEIKTADDTKEFFLPRKIFNSLSEFDLIRIAGRWCNLNGNYFLIATKLDRVETVGVESQSFRLAKIGRKARCRYCGRQLLANERWQVNSNWVPECGDCSAFRDNRDPTEFERFCCRLLRHRAKRR